MVYSTDRSKSVLTRCFFVVYSTRRFVLSLTLCYFVIVFFIPFSIAITSPGEERANLSAFRTFIRFALAWFCLFCLPLGVWEGLRLVIVALPELFSYLFLRLTINVYGQIRRDLHVVFLWSGFRWPFSSMIILIQNMFAIWN